MPEPAYFLYHSIGLYPGKATEMAAVLSDFATTWAAPDDSQWPQALALRAEYLDRWAKLINVAPDTITTADNVTAALASLIGALPERQLRGKRVLVAADCFPSLHFLLAGMAARRGFTLDTVPIPTGAAWVPDAAVLDRWGEDVALALLTFVTSTASHRPDLQALVEHGRRMGSLCVVDITQGVGLLPFDAGALGADAVVSTSLKWLCGAPGAGILHVTPALTAACAPELRGWFSQPNPFAWDLDGFDYAPDIRRFDHGTPSVIAAAATVPALRWQAAQDHGALLEHTRILQDTLIDEASQIGLTLASPRAANQRGGSVMLRLPDTSDPASVVDTLRAQSLHLDARGRVLRLSPGNQTTEADVARLIAALPAAL